jgi:hypothetical protein
MHHMTEAEQQALNKLVADHPTMQFAVRAMRAWDTADGIGAALMVGVTKFYVATLMNHGYSIDEINVLLPVFIASIETQLREMQSEMARWLDEPSATLQ